MADILEILKFTIPSLLVVGMAYLMMKHFFDREIKTKYDEITAMNRKEYTPMRIQAYERAVLYLERIDPNNLIMRVHAPGMTARALHAELMKAIRDEYTHNMVQQLYITHAGWKALKQAKEESIKIINMAMNSMKENATSIDLSTVIFEIMAKLDRIPTDRAIDIVKRDFQKQML
jgi:hypothetical protein